MVDAIEKVVIFLLLPLLIIWLLGILPPVVIQNKADIVLGIENIGVTLRSVSSFFPVGVFFQCMLVWLLVYNVELLMRIGMWLIRKLPLGIN